LGKVMELQVYDFFKKELPGARVELGRLVGAQGYDVDIYAEDEQIIYGVEVKPGKVKILESEEQKASSKSNKTLEYKLRVGAFKHLIENEAASDKKTRLYVFIYQHNEIYHQQIEDFNILLRRTNQLDQPVKLVWLKPTTNYKTNVNWRIDKKQHLKVYDFEKNAWLRFSL
ncbi:MAG: hypothetical protein AAFU64_19100, partial [Bacteroidota bacterium]